MLRVVNAKSFTLVVAKVEFGKIALQVLLADLVVHAVNAALHDREVAFNRVGMDAAAHILASAPPHLLGALRGIAKNWMR